MGWSEKRNQTKKKRFPPAHRRIAPRVASDVLLPRSILVLNRGRNMRFVVPSDKDEYKLLKFAV